MSLRVDLEAEWPDFRLRVRFAAEEGTIGIFGASGAGKTSLLEVIAGLRPAARACIELNGITLTHTRKGVFIPVPRRRIGYVPQHLALFPHLSVRQNLLYGADGAGPFTLAHLSELLELEPLLGRGLGRLSGGEQQRVALGRALLSRPRLLLLDEPLASLDIPLKERILPFLRRIREAFAIPILYVSHDPGEIVALCSQVLLLERGEAQPLRPPSAVFEPHTETIYRLRSVPETPPAPPAY